MKFEKVFFKPTFCLTPHKCSRCDNTFWFERMYKHINRYRETRYYCKDCAPLTWSVPESEAGNESQNRT